MKRSAKRRRFLAGVVTAAISTTVALVAGPASAISAPIHTTANVNLRPGPSTDSGSPILVIPKGSSPDYHCWTRGEKIGTVDVWFNVTWAGKTGYYASYYDDSSYTTDDQITTKYHIPPCGGGGNGAEQAAVTWANGQLGSTAWSGLCLSFVRNAWAAGGVDLRSLVNVSWGSDTYPLDIWGHFKSGSTGTGAPTTPGALIFFYGTGDKGSSTYRTNSHVEIYVGNNTYISTPDYVNEANVHTETFGQHARELGWWLPE